MACDTILFVSWLKHKCFKRKFLRIFEDVWLWHTYMLLHWCFCTDSFRLLNWMNNACKCSGCFLCHPVLQCLVTRIKIYRSVSNGLIWWNFIVYQVGIYAVSQKNIPDIFDFNLKTNNQILLIFGTNIPDTTCHQMTIQLSTSPNVCFCTTWGNHNQRNITFKCDMIA